jgi:protoheme IX farnesyltransferase
MNEKKQNGASALSLKLKDYYLLTKFTLSFTVVFSSVVCYLLVPSVEFEFISVLLLFVGGMLVTGAANAINQVTEKDTDALMNRTSSRPVASGRMSVDEASSFAVIAAISGTFLIGLYFNWTAAGISLFSLFLYGFIYTPLKKVHSIAVLVGAIPGALPCLIGWAAGDPTLGIGGWILFTLQFFWQFPHFWAIAWLVYDDYAKADFYLLPSMKKDGRNKSSALQIIFYVLCLIGLSFIPFYLGISGLIACVLMALSGLMFLWFAVQLYFKTTKEAAKKLMFASLLYQVIVFIALMANKI